MTFDTEFEIQEIRAIQHEYVNAEGKAYTTFGWDASWIIGKLFGLVNLMESEITMIDHELEQLQTAYQDACDAAGANQQRAREAETEIRQILNDIER